MESGQFPTVKTVEDFTRAAAAADPAQRHSHLQEAQKLVVDCFSARTFLRQLITHHLGDDALRRRSADRVLATATAERDINGVRDAAEFERVQRGNVSAAFSILDDAIDLFATPADEFGFAKYVQGQIEPAPGYVFVLLAEDFAQLPNGRDGVLRALTVGRDVHLESGSPEDLEDIARGWIELIDHDEGGALLAKAQARRVASQQVPVGDSPRFPEPRPPGEPYPSVRSTFGPQPSASALLDLIRSNISQPSLVTIAEADYGMDFPAHLAALAAIADTGLVGTPTAPIPGEVLALYRWHCGGTTDHLSRALCCAVLTLDATLLYGTAFMVTTAPYLVESCLVLGRDYVAAGRRLLAWRFCATPEEDSDGPVDRQSSMLAALLLDVLSGAGLPDWSRAELDFAALNAEFSGDPVGKPTSAAVWRHLLALALLRIPGDEPQYSIVASALAALEQD